MNSTESERDTRSTQTEVIVRVIASESSGVHDRRNESCVRQPVAVVQAARMTEQGRLHSVLLTVSRRRRGYSRGGPQNDQFRGSVSPSPSPSPPPPGGDDRNGKEGDTHSGERQPLRNSINTARYDGTGADSSVETVSVWSVSSCASGDTAALCPTVAGAERHCCQESAKCGAGNCGERRKRRGGKLRRIRKRTGTKEKIKS